MAYLLDANVLIAAKNLHYGMDFCPAFWDWIVIAHQTGKIFSIDKVADELSVGQDDLADWAANLPGSFFLDPDHATLSAMGVVANWVNTHPKYSAAAKSTFLQIADFYLISQALAGRHAVVTHETPADSINRIKIPNVCIGLKLDCMSPFQMLRREHARFVLPAAALPPIPPNQGG